MSRKRGSAPSVAASGKRQRGGPAAGEPAMPSERDDVFGDSSSVSSSGLRSTGEKSVLTCGLCGGTSLDTNPCPTRHKGPTLVFANSTECLVCRNFSNGSIRHMSRATLKVELQDQKTRRSIAGAGASTPRFLTAMLGSSSATWPTRSRCRPLCCVRKNSPVARRRFLASCGLSMSWRGKRSRTMRKSW